MRKLTTIRKIVQGFFLLLFIFVLWSTTYPLKGSVSPQVLFKIDPLLMFATSLSERIILPGLFLAFLMILLSFVFGRFFCGWICPMGTMIDIVGKAAPRQKKKFTERQQKKIRRPKYFVLGAIFLFAVAGIQAAWLFDPIVITARVISLSVIPSVTLALNKIFIFLIQEYELYGGFYDFYRGLKESFLGVNVHFFANSLFTFIFFMAVCLVSLFLSRAWCRSVCPLGAFYSLVSRHAFLKRFVRDCNDCGACSRQCRMGAIKDDNQYEQGECILCMDCVYACRQGKTVFAFKRAKQGQHQGQNDLKDKKGGAPKASEQGSSSKGLSRRGFLFLMFWSVPAMAWGKGLLKTLRISSGALRPPGALEEEKFVDRCVRCGNCMKVCITNGLQPILFQEGVEALWTPQLVPEIGYCEYHCTLCGEVCPTGAIAALSLEQKNRARIGTARINKSLCIPWAENENCLVCEEHCPVSDKAIKVEETVINGKKILRPFVDASLCIGCGICQNKCPVRPQRAVKVFK